MLYLSIFMSFISKNKYNKKLKIKYLKLSYNNTKYKLYNDIIIQIRNIYLYK